VCVVYCKLSGSPQAPAESFHPKRKEEGRRKEEGGRKKEEGRKS
jgi:hypothetical protein